MHLNSIANIVFHSENESSLAYFCWLTYDSASPNGFAARVVFFAMELRFCDAPVPLYSVPKRGTGGMLPTAEILDPLSFGTVRLVTLAVEITDGEDAAATAGFATSFSKSSFARTSCNMSSARVTHSRKSSMIASCLDAIHNFLMLIQRKVHLRIRQWHERSANMLPAYEPRAHVVAYDPRAWERSASPFAPEVPLPAPFAAAVAIELFGTTSVWDTLACFACLTHGKPDVAQCVASLFKCSAERAAALLREDAHACRPWLQIGLCNNVWLVPHAVLTTSSNWLLVQTPDNRRYVAHVDGDTRAVTCIYSVSSGARKPPGALVLDACKVIESADAVLCAPAQSGIYSRLK